jgi:hypothetical protein
MRRNEAYGAWQAAQQTDANQERLRQLRETKLREGVAATRHPSREAGALQLYIGLMLAACSPFGPCFVSKLTF